MAPYAVCLCVWLLSLSVTFPAFARIAMLISVSFWSPLHSDLQWLARVAQLCLPKHCPPHCGRATESRGEELGYRTGHGGRHR